MITLSADWIVPMRGPWLRDGWITVDEETITQIGVGSPPEGTVHLQDRVIAPALLNPHLHLEFSDLPQPLGEPGMSFPAWIGAVVRWRRSQSNDPEETKAAKQNAISRGLEELYRSGTCYAGEIASPPYELSDYTNDRVQLTLFHEFLGLSADRRAAAWSQLRLQRDKWQQAKGKLTGVSTWGLSPHAPYTVRRQDVAGLAQDADEHGEPVAMHLAESLPELQLVEQADGEFRTMLQAVGAWTPGEFPRAEGVLGELEALGTKSASQTRTLVVHGNYLNEPHWEWLSQHAASHTLVYCPRTHAYFNHSPYPLMQLLDRNIRVVLGTDSRASNPDLSVWREWQFVSRRYASLDFDQSFGMVTRDAAQALGVEDRFGTLEPGRPFRAIALPALEDPTKWRDWLDDSVDPIPLWPLDAEQVSKWPITLSN